LNETNEYRITIFYVHPVRIPSEKAHSIQIINTLSGLKEIGCNPILLCPKRKQSKVFLKLIDGKENDLRKYYGIKTLPCVKKLPTVDFIAEKENRMSWIVHLLFFWFFALINLLRLRFGIHGKKYLYTRDISTAFFLLIFKWLLHLPIIFELHNKFEKITILNGFVLKNVSGIVVISKNLKKFLLRKALYRKGIAVIPDASKENNLEINETFSEKFKLTNNIPLESKIILYCGHLYPWKNVELLIDAMKFLDHQKYFLIIVGGLKKDIIRVMTYAEKKEVKNLKFFGFRPPSEIPCYMKISDLGVLTVSSKAKNVETAESPMKLFEYMASRLPVIGANTPTLREVIDDGITGILYEKDSARDLSEKIRLITTNDHLRSEIIKNEFEKFKNKYSYGKRARNIVDFLKKRIFQFLGFF